MPLTDTAIKNAKPAAKPTRLFDCGGLYLEISLGPLATQAVAILRELHSLTGGGRYLFPGARDRNHPMSDAAINAALRRRGYDTCTEITGHGFRAMAWFAPYARRAAEGGRSPDTMESGYGAVPGPDPIEISDNLRGLAWVVRGRERANV